ncbi:MAG: hypothetical protein AAGI53_00540 [Planctomycetota bacterium]
MTVIALECLDLNVAVDSAVGCGLLGIWRVGSDGRRPVVPPSPFPDTSAQELIGRWQDDRSPRSVPIRIVHRTPLSISWCWPDGATGRWELEPNAVIVSWRGVCPPMLRLANRLDVARSETTMTLTIPTEAADGDLLAQDRTR